MASKNSWRLRFIDIDASFSISTEAGDVKGYTVVRAPKGETEPYFFSKGNAEAIRAYVGLESSTYPDIAEAIAYNAEYGLYISAPAGSDSDYPSYFGGSYVTSEGLIPLYNVTNKDTIDFTKNEELATLGTEELPCKLTTFVNKTFPYASEDGDTISAKHSTLAFQIGPIDASNWPDLKEFAVNYWGDKRTGHASGMTYYLIDKDNHKIYCEDEEGLPITSVYAGMWVKSGPQYYVFLGGENWLFESAKGSEDEVYSVAKLAANDTILDSLGIKSSSNNTVDSLTIPYFTFDGLFNKVEEYCFSAEDSQSEWTKVVNHYMSGADVSGIVGKEFAYNGAVNIVGPAKDTTVNFSSLVDIKSKTYGVLVQKSPCEKVTNVKITNIGYDKWKYDNALPVIYGDLASSEALTYAENNLSTFVHFGADYAEDENPSVAKIYTFNKDLKGSTLKDKVVDVTKEYVSQSFMVSSCYNLDSQEATGHSLHNIYYVVSKTSILLETEDSAFPLIPDNSYNTMTFNVTEEVYPGQMTNGGEFTGSFDEMGKDSYGTNIFWPNVLNENDFSFLEIIPTGKVFDKELDSHGIFTGERIVDDVITGIAKTAELKLKGQRFVTHVAEENIRQGMIGGAWADGYDQILRAGWEEAFDENYDDVYVFMGLTGQPTEVVNLANIVTGTHKLAIAIAPYIINKGTFNNPNTIVVPTRSKQLALFAGEFQIYDSYTGKNYWCCPIGDVGKMCSRIFDRKMGGWAPAWYNYNDMGGQLSRPVLKARWNFKDAATHIMDTKGINPIVYNPDDGLMIVSSKTTQDPNNLTDWSFLEHVMSFCLVKREIRDNVMRPQIKKPIDDYWMGIRQKQVDAILAKRTQGPNKIWTAAKCAIAGVNTDITKAQRDFRINVTVKVTPFAETVTLTLINVDQTTNV